jgi:hypothetical protein
METKIWCPNGHAFSLDLEEYLERGRLRIERGPIKLKVRDMNGPVLVTCPICGERLAIERKRHGERVEESTR